MPVFSIITERDDLERSNEFRKNSENSERIQKIQKQFRQKPRCKKTCAQLVHFERNQK